MKKSALFAGTIVALATLCGLHETASASASDCGDKDVVFHAIALRPGVSANIHVHVFDNPHTSCKADAVLAIHGASGTASTWEPMAHAVFSAHPHASRPCKFIAMDLPGHGASSLPTGAMFGDLSLDDYASAVIGTLAHLEWSGVHVKEIMGHSMGGLVTLMVQQRLVDHGSSLREAFGVKRAVMLAPAMPAAIPSAFASDPSAAAFLAPFICFDPVLGARFLIPDELFPALAFSRPDHTIASNAPTPAEITEHGYNGPESFTALSGLIGAPPVERPDVDAGIFSHKYRTRLELVTFENDAIVLPEEGSALYTYLTGDDDLSRFTVVEGDDAVHGTPISDPEAVLDALQDIDD